MPGFRLELTPAAQRQLSALRGPVLVGLRGVILALADEPLPPSAHKLAGMDDLWRVRVSIDGLPWRVVYQLRAKEKLIVVMRVAHRDEATYRNR